MGTSGNPAFYYYQYDTQYSNIYPQKECSKLIIKGYRIKIKYKIAVFLSIIIT